MFPILLSWAAWFFFFHQFIFKGFRIGSFFATLLILAVSFLAIFLWFIMRLTRPRNHPANRARQASRVADKLTIPEAKQPQPDPRPAAAPARMPVQRSITFRVAGTSHQNQDGSSRQEILRHLKFGDPPYANPGEDLDVTIEQSTWQGEPALPICVNGYQIGFVPRDHIPEIQDALKTYAWTIDAARVTGGGNAPDGTPLTYGFSITLSYIK